MATYYIDGRQTPGAGSGTSASPYAHMSQAPKGAHTYYIEQSSTYAYDEPIRWTGVNTGEIKILAYKAASLGATPATADSKPTHTNCSAVGSWSSAGVAWIDSTGDGGQVKFGVPGAGGIPATAEMLYITASSAKLAAGDVITQGGVTATVCSLSDVGGGNAWSTAEQIYDDDAGAAWAVIKSRSGGTFARGAATATGGKTLTLFGASGANLYFTSKRALGVFGSSVLGKAGPSNKTTDTRKWGLFMPRPGQEWRGQYPDSTQQALSGTTEGTIVYSVGGNPSAVYGDVYVSDYSDGNLSTGSGTGGVFHFDDCLARTYVTGHKFLYVYGPTAHTHRFAAAQGGDQAMTDGYVFSYNEVAFSGGNSVQTPSGYTADDNFTSAEQALGGYRNCVVEYNYAHDMPDTLLNSGNGWISYDGMQVRYNVIARTGLSTSTGGIYMAGWHVQNDDTDVNKRIQVYGNSISGIRSGNGFIGEGFAVYCERDSHRIDVHHNFAWDCDKGYQNNGGKHHVMHSNYLCKPNWFAGRTSVGMFNFGNAENRTGCSQIIRNNINNGDACFVNFGSNGSVRDWNVELTNNISIGSVRTGLSNYERAFAGHGVFTAAKTITAITKANPARVTAAGHGLTTGRRVWISAAAGMTEIRGGPYVMTRIDADTLTLDGVDSSAYSTYTGSGKLVPLPFWVVSGNKGWLHSNGYDYRSSDTAGDTGNEGYTNVNMSDVVLQYFPDPVDPSVNYALQMPQMSPMTEWDLSLDDPFGDTTPVAFTMTRVSPAYEIEDRLTSKEVTVYGTGFKDGDFVRFNGIDAESTTFVSSTELTVSLQAALFADPGTFNVRVIRNSATKTNVLPFVVYAAPPVLSSVDPSSVLAGATGVTLTLAGTGFVEGQEGRVNGETRTLTVNSSIEAVITVDDSDVAYAGTASIAVWAPNAGLSNELSLDIGTPPETNPVVTSLDPEQVFKGATGVEVTINGTGFIPGTDEFRISGATLETTFESTTQFRAEIPASYLAEESIWWLRIYRSAEIKSNQKPLSVVKDPDKEEPKDLLPPILYSVSPRAIEKGSTDTTITLRGERFASGQTLVWNEETPIEITLDTDQPDRLATVVIPEAYLVAATPVAIYINDATEGPSDVLGISVVDSKVEPRPSEPRQLRFGISIFGS